MCLLGQIKWLDHSLHCGEPWHGTWRLITNIATGPHPVLVVQFLKTWTVWPPTVQKLTAQVQYMMRSSYGNVLCTGLAALRMHMVSQQTVHHPSSHLCLLQHAFLALQCTYQNRHWWISRHHMHNVNYF